VVNATRAFGQPSFGVEKEGVAVGRDFLQQLEINFGVVDVIPREGIGVGQSYIAVV
jgi:hypothetical protein